MKRFRCGDVVPGCNATFAGSLDEILLAVADHARLEHGLPEVPVEVDRLVRERAESA